MEIGVTVWVPKLIYDIYAEAAAHLGTYSTEQVMSSALRAYARYLFEEMRSDGEFSDNTPWRIKRNCA